DNPKIVDKNNLPSNLQAIYERTNKLPIGYRFQDEQLNKIPKKGSENDLFSSGGTTIKLSKEARDSLDKRIRRQMGNKSYDTQKVVENLVRLGLSDSSQVKDAPSNDEIEKGIPTDEDGNPIES
ncbi:hypothetical protein KC669_04075, partial [Candidatus Dojkabacteria bacterium]|nr:hypothetical protein [Candidatus Dojkabacteria bacterium]